MKIIKNFYEFAHKFEFKENFIFLDLITIELIGEVFTKSFILDKDLRKRSLFTGVDWSPAYLIHDIEIILQE